MTSLRWSDVPLWTIEGIMRLLQWLLLIKVNRAVKLLLVSSSRPTNTHILGFLVLLASINCMPSIVLVRLWRLCLSRPEAVI